MSGNIFAQKAPGATTLTDLYQVSAGNKATITKIWACNTDVAGATVRISIARQGAADTVSQYLYYDHAISGSDVLLIADDPTELTLNAGDVIRVYSSNGKVSFHAFGREEKS